MRKPIIAIDFDGTIVENAFPLITGLRLNAVEAIQDLAKDCEIILWTCRSDKHLTEACLFCSFHNIPINYVNHNSPAVSFHPEPKIYYDILVDDRQVGGLPDDWWEINRMVRAQLKAWGQLEE